MPGARLKNVIRFEGSLGVPFPGNAWTRVVVLGEEPLRRIVRSYARDYDRSRTHLALGKDAPEPRMIHGHERGKGVALPEGGGLHHRYERRAA